MQLWDSAREKKNFGYHLCTCHKITTLQQGISRVIYACFNFTILRFSSCYPVEQMVVTVVFTLLCKCFYMSITISSAQLDIYNSSFLCFLLELFINAN